MKPTSVRIYESSEKSGSIMHWIRHIELLATVNDWSETQKCAFAVANLKGPAAFWLDTFTFTSWEAFQAGINERFGDDPDQMLDNLMMLKQGMHEAVEDYVENFNVLLSSCADAGTVVPVLLCLNLFVDGLQSHLRTKVKARRPADLDEAISDAKLARVLEIRAGLGRPYLYDGDYKQEPQNDASAILDTGDAVFND